MFPLSSRAGYADCVRCFQCGLGLRSWKKGDDIFVEHQRHKPQCQFLHIRAERRQQAAASLSTEDLVNQQGETNGCRSCTSSFVLFHRGPVWSSYRAHAYHPISLLFGYWVRVHSAAYPDVPSDVSGEVESTGKKLTTQLWVNQT